MTRLSLKPSRLLLVTTAALHFLAMLAPWFSALPVWCDICLLLVLGVSLYHQSRRIRLQAADSIIALELRGEECMPVRRSPGQGAYQLAQAVYCSASLQILGFHRPGAAWWLPVNRYSPVLVMPDSCSADEQRRLRRFLRWRC